MEQNYRKDPDDFRRVTEKFDSSSDDDDDIGVVRSIRRRRHSMSSTMQGLVFALIVIVLVVGSFWLSFMIGKRILLPAKKTPAFDMNRPVSMVVPPPYVATPEPVALPVVKEVPTVHKVKVPVIAKKIAAIKGKIEKTIKEKKKAKPVVKKKIVVPVVVEKPAVEKTAVKEEKIVLVSDKLSIVQVEIADSKEKAISDMKDLENKGFDVFAKDIDGKRWRVQAGAFKDKKKADSLILKLKSNGSSAKIVND